MSSILNGGLSIWDKRPSATQPELLTTLQAAVSNGVHAKSTTPILNKIDYAQLAPMTLSHEERYQRCLSVGLECVQPEELHQLLLEQSHPICYDGFEPSGRMHIAQGVVKANNVNKLTQSGCIFIFWVADWFAYLNRKMDGDQEKIRNVGLYFIEVWKALGMDMRNVRFLWASEEINADPETYWNLVLDISTKFNISRIKRCSQIMGRKEGDAQLASQILYPLMQCADIFFLKANVCQLGMDQRKINMLAREYADLTQQKQKPICLSHAMLPGLLQGQEKMSKSNSDSAIFMEDSAAEVKKKIKKAFCPPGVIEDNPCIAFVEQIIFEKYGKFFVERTPKNGGDIEFHTMDQVKAAYLDGSLHPGDIKSNLAREINKMLEPVRQHFKSSPAKELFEKVMSYQKK